MCLWKLLNRRVHIASFISNLVQWQINNKNFHKMSLAFFFLKVSSKHSVYRQSIGLAVELLNIIIPCQKIGMIFEIMWLTKIPAFKTKDGLKSEKLEKFYIAKDRCQKAILNFYILYMAITKCQFSFILHLQAKYIW